MKVSLLTCTFNRASTLKRLHQSICSQSILPHEWIIVNDGSTDETEDILNDIQREARFPIAIINQSNHGKHIAWNRGLSIVTGDYLMGIDSDNMLTPNCFDMIMSIQKNLSLSEHPFLVRAPTIKLSQYSPLTHLQTFPIVEKRNWLDEWWHTYKHDEFVDIFDKSVYNYLYLPGFSRMKWFPEILSYSSISGLGLDFYYIDQPLQIYDDTLCADRLSLAFRSSTSILNTNNIRFMLVIASSRLLVVSQSQPKLLSKNLGVFTLNLLYVFAAISLSITATCLSLLLPYLRKEKQY